MFINNFDPVAFNLFSLEFRWYSLAYIFGILAGWVLAKRNFIKEDSLKEDINKIYSERKKIYDQSNFRVKCDTLDLYQIVNKIVKIYENTTN